MSQSRKRSVQNISQRWCLERTFLQESVSTVSTATLYRSRCETRNSQGVGDKDSQNAIVEPKGVRPIGVSALKQN